MPRNPYQPINQPLDDDEEYTVVPVIPVDYQYHTDAHPQCFDPDCDCKQERIAELNEDYQDGLLSAADATRIAQGKTI